MIDQLDDETIGYPCKFIKTNNMGQLLWCGNDQDKKLQITLLTKDGIVTFYSLSGHGEPQDIEIVTSFRLGAFNFSIVADEKDYLYLMLVPSPLNKGLSKHFIYDFGLDLDVRELFKIISNQIVITPATILSI
jgi:hypothetical protein